MRKPVITIDGPAGAGKSTIAKLVAKRLGLRFLDTGAMFRSVALRARQLGLADPREIAKIIASTPLVETPEIRTPGITRAVKPIAESPECRAELARLQREIGRDGGLVTEGRDQGSVVFPDAEYKFYLEGSIDERARRRHAEAGGDLDQIKREIAERDRADMTRECGPLVRPKGAIEVDTTGMTIDQVVEAICARIR